MKKTKLFMLLITIFVMSMTMGVFAADKAALTVNVSGDTSKNGEITVKLDLSNSSNLGGVEAELVYDKTKLQYTKGELVREFSSSAAASDLLETEAGVKATLAFNDPKNYNGTIAEIKFKVLAGEGENVAINLNSNLVDIDYNEMEVENKNAEFAVKIPITSIEILGEKDIVLEKGGASTMLTVNYLPSNTTETNKTVYWTSSDESVAKVSSEGKLTAVGGGQAVITATTEVGGLTAKVNVIVAVNLEGIDILASSNTVEEGKSLTLQIVPAPTDATQEIGIVNWASSDELIAKVDEKGIVTGIKAGKVKITAEALGFTKEIIIKVEEPKTEQPNETQPEDKTRPESETKAEQKTTEKVKDETTTVKINTTINGKVKTGDSDNTGIIVMMFVSISVFGAVVFGKKYSVKK